MWQIQTQYSGDKVKRAGAGNRPGSNPLKIVCGAINLPSVSHCASYTTIQVEYEHGVACRTCKTVAALLIPVQCPAQSPPRSPVRGTAHAAHSGSERAYVTCIYNGVYGSEHGEHKRECT
jgi:hypothetical protein